MKRLLSHLGSISGTVTKTVVLTQPFSEMAARFTQKTGTVVLLSGGNADCSRHHILAIWPWLSVTGRNQKTTVHVTKQNGTDETISTGQTISLSHAPLTVLQHIVERCTMAVRKQVQGPIAAGLFGYLAYDLKDDIESLPRTTVDDLNLPHLYLFAPTVIVVHDRHENITRVHAPVYPGSTAKDANAAVERFLAALAAPAPAVVAPASIDTPQSNCTRVSYLNAIRKVKDYIEAGDVYQVNLSHRFETRFVGDSYALLQQLYTTNPAPFFAYINAGDHQIVSTSPERFLLRDGDRVETRPIKGTRPRGKKSAEDAQLKANLAASPKDDAELSMLVDLLRNDLGKVCQANTVKVTQHKRLEAYENVYHLVSIIEGRLSAETRVTDLIKAAFPGGSITGCPKIRAMEIIDELERVRRHIYTGSIGYISFHDTMDLSIAIRTATVVAESLVFSVGGGIVYDSDPDDEYAETIHKGKTLLDLLQPSAANASSATTEGWVWQDGHLTQNASVPIADLGLQYGFGIFETIRVEMGTPRLLPAHIERFNRTWCNLFQSEPPDVTWHQVIAQVIEANGLANDTAAVKLIATRGDVQSEHFSGTLAVSARRYVDRLHAAQAEGLRLASYPHTRSTPLAEHKTLNYLYYYRAGQWARTHDADEALILNADGSVSETNTANLLLIKDKTALRPQSPYVLSGVMQAEICRRLQALGFTLADRTVHPSDLFEAETVLLTNALIGALPVISVDGNRIDHDETLVATLRGAT